MLDGFYKTFFVVVITAVVAGGAVYFAMRPAVPATSPAPVDTNTVAVATNDATKTEPWSLYSSANLRFQIARPVDAKVEESKTDTDYERNSLGRVGAVGINLPTETSPTRPHLSISVYTDKTKLERDLGVTPEKTLDESLGSVGLKKTSVVIDGNSFLAYAGTHIVDAPGEGGPGWPYVLVEIPGPTYYYILEFSDFTANPADATIARYLDSFKTY